MKQVSSIQTAILLMTAVLIAASISAAGGAKAENPSITPAYSGDCPGMNVTEINITVNTSQAGITPVISPKLNFTAVNVSLHALNGNPTNSTTINWTGNGGTGGGLNGIVKGTSMALRSSPALIGFGLKTGAERVSVRIPAQVGQPVGMGISYLHTILTGASGNIVSLLPVGGGGNKVTGPAVTPEQFVATSLLSTIIMAFASVFVSGSRYPVFVPLYTRLNRDDMLENPTREGIYRMVAQNPGIDLVTLKRRLELSNGVLAYHIHTLERERYLRSVRDGRFRRFYISGIPVGPGSSIESRILRKIEARPMVNQSQLAKEMNLTRQAVNYHIRKLVKSGKVVAEKKGRETLIRRRST